MPNPSNLLTPITVWGSGRSGSSLLANIFSRHPDVHVVGETFPLIFGIGAVLADQFGNVHQRANSERLLTPDERAAENVRRLFEYEFPSPQPRWMHKPVGLHDIVNWRIQHRGLEAVQSWARELFEAVFPQSRDILIVRNPADVILSGSRYWRFPVDEMATALLTAAQLHRAILKEDSFRFRLEELIGESRESVLRKLFAYCELSFSDEVMAAFAVKHAQYPGSFGREKQEDRASVDDFRPTENLTLLLAPDVMEPMRQVYAIYEELRVPYRFELDLQRIKDHSMRKSHP